MLVTFRENYSQGSEYPGRGQVVYFAIFSFWEEYLQASTHCFGGSMHGNKFKLSPVFISSQ